MPVWWAVAPGPRCPGSVGSAVARLPGVAAIDDLIQLVPPPHVPVDSTGDWQPVEAELGLELPADYKALIERYGVGRFVDFISPLTPFGDNPYVDLIRIARLLAEDDEPFRQQHPGISPYPFYPAPGGLVPWAQTDNGDRLCWLTIGPPEEWITVSWNPRDWTYDTHQVSAVEFLYGWITGAISSTVFGDGDDAVPWFEPYRERQRITFRLSDSPLPYAERLRILREALGPTADRGSYENGRGRRQDHFAATEREWRLTYETAYGHGVRVWFPRGDDERVRTVLPEVIARMGCEIVGTTPQ